MKRIITTVCILLATFILASCSAELPSVILDEPDYGYKLTLTNVEIDGTVKYMDVTIDNTSIRDIGVQISLQEQDGHSVDMQSRMLHLNESASNLIPAKAQKKYRFKLILDTREETTSNSHEFKIDIAIADKVESLDCGNGKFIYSIHDEDVIFEKTDILVKN